MRRIDVSGPVNQIMNTENLTSIVFAPNPSKYFRLAVVLQVAFLKSETRKIRRSPTDFVDTTSSLPRLSIYKQLTMKLSVLSLILAASSVTAFAPSASEVCFV